MKLFLVIYVELSVEYKVGHKTNITFSKQFIVEKCRRVLPNTNSSCMVFAKQPSEI